MESILATQAGAGDEQIAQGAQKMAELLGKTVQASIEMGNALEFGMGGEHGDSLRVALAGLTGPLIAAQYKRTGHMPGEAEIKKFTAAFQAVQTFSENFTPDEAHTQRLAHIVADADQAGLQYINAFIPVVNAISAFPFGQQEQTLLMNVAGRLVQKSMELREAFAGNLSNDENKQVELGVLEALGRLYAACHEGETQKLMAPGNQTPADINNVWKSFDLRAAMLETLVRSMVPGGGQSSASSGGISPDTAPKQGTAPPAAPASIDPAAVISEPPTPQEPPPSSTPAAPPAPEAPPQPPPTAPEAPQEQSPAPPPAEEKKDTPPPANPMGFFKPGAKKDDES